jgi:putative DNA primase/helicase
MVDHALAYARIGWHVVPLHTPVGAGCSCRKRDCDNVGKHPRTMHGLKDATTDESQVTEWWGMWPTANIGVVCGPSRIVAIDIDPRHGGDESYSDLVRQHGKKTLTDTVSASTGGGGEHYIFAAPRGEHIVNVSNSPKFEGPLGVGVDVRAGGGYIVVAPSLHVSGSNYEWQEGYSPFDREPALLPHPLFELLSTTKPQDAPHELVSMKDILAGVPEGARDWELFRAAAKLRYADVPVDMALRLITEAAANCTPPFPQSEAIKKVRSAYERYEAGSGAAVTVSETPPEPVTRVLLNEVIKKGAPPTKWLVQDVLIHGFIHLVFGEPESGKTILALAWLRYCVENKIPVLFVDEESGMVSIADKLRAMGVEDVDSFLYYYPFPSLDLEGVAGFLEVVDAIRPGLIIFDSLTDMLASSGLDENSGIEVTNWMKALPETLSRRDYSPAVVLIDHISKDAANVKYSVASRAKKAKSDVLWYVFKDDDFDRTKTAAVDLIRHKNRPGVLPQKVRYIVGGRDGVLVAEPYEPTQHGVSAMPEGTARLLQYVIDRGGEALTSEAARDLDVTRQTVGTWAKYLLARDMVQRVGESHSAGFRVLEKGLASVRSDGRKSDLTEALPSDPSVRSAAPLGADLTEGRRVAPSDLPSDLEVDPWLLD